MKLRSLGEFGLIRRIAKKADRETVLVGIGDDAAVVKVSHGNNYLLLTTDMLIEGVHFLKSKASPYQIGHKAVAVNISDIAAMGGFPKYGVVSLGLPKDTDVEFVDRMYKGMRKVSGKFKMDIVGGDISLSQKLVVNVALVGEVERKNLILRKGARAGDLLFVTGTLGGATKKKHLIFKPRLEEARLLVKNFHPTSMIDISDGLSQDLSHLTCASGVGAVLYEELIPVFRRTDCFTDALSEGEDYELLFTISSQEIKRFLKVSRRWKVKVSCIGEIVEEGFGMKLVDKKGNTNMLKPKGYSHF